MAAFKQAGKNSLETVTSDSADIHTVGALWELWESACQQHPLLSWILLSYLKHFEISHYLAFSIT